MTQTPALPLHTRSIRPPPARLESAEPVEIIAPNGYCAALLLEDAARLFPAEIVSDAGWIVRLRPPPGEAWVLEVLSLVERWLDSIPLPSTRMFYGAGSHVIRTSTGGGTHVTTSEASTHH